MLNLRLVKVLDATYGAHRFLCSWLDECGNAHMGLLDEANVLPSAEK